MANSIGSRQDAGNRLQRRRAPTWTLAFILALAAAGSASAQRTRAREPGDGGSRARGLEILAKIFDDILDETERKAGSDAILSVISAAQSMRYKIFQSPDKLEINETKWHPPMTLVMLGSMRSVLSFYYGDTEGVYPSDLAELIGKKYLPGIPKARTGVHEPTRKVTVYTSRDPASLKDTGGWGYVNNPDSGAHGEVFVDCTHKDYKGREWHGH